MSTGSSPAWAAPLLEYLGVPVNIVSKVELSAFAGDPRTHIVLTVPVLDIPGDVMKQVIERRTRLSVEFDGATMTVTLPNSLDEAEAMQAGYDDDAPPLISLDYSPRS